LSPSVCGYRTRMLYSHCLSCHHQYVGTERACYTAIACLVTTSMWVQNAHVIQPLPVLSPPVCEYRTRMLYSHWLSCHHQYVGTEVAAWNHNSFICHDSEHTLAMYCPFKDRITKSPPRNFLWTLRKLYGVQFGNYWPEMFRQDRVAQYVHLRVCVRARLCVCARARYLCVCVRASISLRACVGLCMCAYVYVCVCIYLLNYLTFKNHVSYIQDGPIATLQILHFMYFFNKYKYWVF
jgi:hypothetical protein